MNIYVASSWRNLLQPAIVRMLRQSGHEVYDFRNPAPGEKGFAWAEIDPDWESWTPDEYRAALKHPIARAGYAHDIGALKRCDCCVLVLPSGRSASWEFGYAMGQGKRGVVVQFDDFEPELMYADAEFATSTDEVFDLFGEPKP
jgi:nucleoside 2-deoxyribosyltransferase